LLPLLQATKKPVINSHLRRLDGLIEAEGKMLSPSNLKIFFPPVLFLESGGRNSGKWQIHLSERRGYFKEPEFCFNVSHLLWEREKPATHLTWKIFPERLVELIRYGLLPGCQIFLSKTNQKVQICSQ
jgi:hypothetical protein